jgi:hypothetical protein
MFETEARTVEERREDAPAWPARESAVPGAAARFLAGLVAGAAAVMLPPLLAEMSQSRESIFPPAPYFLLALGVGLFIGMVVVLITLERS